MQDQPLHSLRDLFDSAGAYLPTLLAGLLVLVLGLLAAWAASRLLVRALVVVRLDRVLERLHWAEALKSGDTRHSLFEFLGVLLGAFVLMLFVANALEIWGLTLLSELLERFLQLIPTLIGAGFIVLVGYGIALAISRNFQRVLYQEGVEHARLIGHVVRWVIVVTVVAIALVQLDIAVQLVTGAYLIAFGAAALGIVLAVGLGSRRRIELMWEERARQRQEERDAGQGPEDGR
jgi:Mechanosensitive ion channel, conserved TM helix